MAEFSYRVRRPSQSKAEKGTIEAESLGEASKRLKGAGMIVLSLSPAKKVGNIVIFQSKRVPLREKIIFTKQLSTMLRAGLPVVQALEALQRQTQHSYFKEVIGTLITQIKGGQQLSKIMAHFPKVFPEVYIAVIKAGEESGKLADVLLDLADQQEKDAELISKIKGAMIYPIIIFLALIGVALLIVFFVLPSLQTVFLNAGADLPFLTRLLIGTSTVARKYYWLYVPLLIALAYFGRVWIRTRPGTAVYDRVKISMPIFGPLTKKVYMARFTRTMSLLANASLPILKSIQIVKKTISNTYYQAAFDRIERAVESGKPMSTALGHEPLFPPMVAQMASLGEQSGSVEKVFLEIAEYYDKEVDQTSKNLATLLEPLMLLIMGIGVGFIVAAVLSPIYKLVETF